MTIMIPAWVNGSLTSVEKLEAHQRGLKHKAVSVFVMNKGRVLVQQRAQLVVQLSWLDRRWTWRWWRWQISRWRGWGISARTATAACECDSARDRQESLPDSHRYSFLISG